MRRRRRCSASGLEGPFSNKALLGVGWADAEIRELRRALVPWMELRGRDLLDSGRAGVDARDSVRAGELDAISQAADHYLNAIEAFYEETNRIDRTIDHIESGEILRRVSSRTIRSTAPAGTGAWKSCPKVRKRATCSTCWRRTSSRKA